MIPICDAGSPMSFHFTEIILDNHSIFLQVLHQQPTFSHSISIKASVTYDRCYRSTKTKHLLLSTQGELDNGSRLDSSRANGPNTDSTVLYLGYLTRGTSFKFYLVSQQRQTVQKYKNPKKE